MDTEKERLEEIGRLAKVVAKDYNCVCAAPCAECIYKSNICLAYKIACRIYDAGYRRTCETNTMTPEAYEKLVDGVIKLYEKNKQLKRKCRKLRKENKRLKAEKGNGEVLRKLKAARAEYNDNVTQGRFALSSYCPDRSTYKYCTDVAWHVVQILDQIIAEVEKPQ